jgi:hypothetical protein
MDNRPDDEVVAVLVLFNKPARFSQRWCVPDAHLELRTDALATTSARVGKLDGAAREGAPPGTVDLREAINTPRLSWKKTGGAPVPKPSQEDRTLPVGTVLSREASDDPVTRPKPLRRSRFPKDGERDWQKVFAALSDPRKSLVPPA